MAAAAGRTARSWRSYHVSARLPAPLDFSYRWCTDFSAGDPRLEGESFTRKVLERTKRRVVFEDLDEQRTGWFWKRDVVDLQPPARWRMRSTGNRREVEARYLLTPVSDRETRLDLWARRRPTRLGGPNPSKVAWERMVATSWRRFAASLAKDYRRA